MEKLSSTACMSAAASDIPHAALSINCMEHGETLVERHGLGMEWAGSLNVPLDVWAEAFRSDTGLHCCPQADQKIWSRCDGHDCSKWNDMSCYSCRSKKMGTRTIAYQDGQVVFFKAIMDNALGEYLGTGLPDISGKYNDRVARNEGKITGFLDELSGRSAYKTVKGKTVKERVSSQLSVQ